MTDEVKVDLKPFKLFLGWYQDNVGKIFSESVMIADRVNYFDEDRNLIAYVYLWNGEHCYIKKEFYQTLFE